MKHTKGPWHIVKHKGDPYYVCSIDSGICRLVDEFEKEAEQKANAYLIAVSPEMLDQLVYVNEALKNWLPKPQKIINQ